MQNGQQVYFSKVSYRILATVYMRYIVVGCSFYRYKRVSALMRADNRRSLKTIFQQPSVKKLLKVEYSSQSVSALNVCLLINSWINFTARQLQESSCLIGQQIYALTIICLGICLQQVSTFSHLASEEMDKQFF